MNCVFSHHLSQRKKNWGSIGRKTYSSCNKLFIHAIFLSLIISITHQLDIKRCRTNFFRINYIDNGRNDNLKKYGFHLTKSKVKLFLIFDSFWYDIEKIYLTILKAGCLLYRHCFRLYEIKQKIRKIKGVLKILCVYTFSAPPLADCPKNKKYLHLWIQSTLYLGQQMLSLYKSNAVFVQVQHRLCTSPTSSLCKSNFVFVQL